MTETEIKLKLCTFPTAHLKDAIYNHINQYYYDPAPAIAALNKSSLITSDLGQFLTELQQAGKIDELRYRCITRSGCVPRYYLTVKGKTTDDSGLTRPEYEFALAHGLGEFLRAHQIGMIEKDRYNLYFLVNGITLTMEVDKFYHDENLVLAEVEFDPNIQSAEKIREAVVEIFSGIEVVDVTADKKYKNKNLAIAS